MGTGVHVVVVGGRAERALDRAQRRINDLERRWSRFRADSEISRLNAARGKATVVSADTYRVIDLAVAAWRLTEGCYDPTVLPALRASGYDRSFERIGADGPVVAREAHPAPGCAGVELVPGVALVSLPAGVEIDLGGIGKGAAADTVVAELLADGAEGACVNVGGDVRVEGRAPTERGWVVGLPGVDGEPSTRAVALSAGAVCTSTVERRRWTTTAGVRHHLVDPRTGLPVDNALRTVSVIAARASQAEVLTKVAFVAGPADAEARLAPYGVSALLVLDDGSTVEVGELEEMAA
jgi:thiamine biosynthesis lipoprotein